MLTLGHTWPGRERRRGDRERGRELWVSSKNPAEGCSGLDQVGRVDVAGVVRLWIGLQGEADRIG